MRVVVESFSASCAIWHRLLWLRCHDSYEEFAIWEKEMVVIEFLVKSSILMPFGGREGCNDQWFGFVARVGVDVDVVVADGVGVGAVAVGGGVGVGVGIDSRSCCLCTCVGFLFVCQVWSVGLPSTQHTMSEKPDDITENKCEIVVCTPQIRKQGPTITTVSFTILVWLLPMVKFRGTTFRKITSFSNIINLWQKVWRILSLIERQAWCVSLTITFTQSGGESRLEERVKWVLMIIIWVDSSPFCSLPYFFVQ